jgi:hypothetical protein
MSQAVELRTDVVVDLRPRHLSLVDGPTRPSELPPPLPRARRIGKRQRFMHHNRLAAGVGMVNLAVLVWGLTGGDLWSTTGGMSAIANAVVANLTLAALIRQQYVINLLFWLATRAPTTWPLKIRWTLGKVYHFGGLHVGGAIAATFWFVLLAGTLGWRAATGTGDTPGPLLTLTAVIAALLLAMIGFALPRFRARFHDRFEKMHRFGGWTALVLFWVHSVWFAAASPGGRPFVGSFPFWALVAVTTSIVLPWLRLRRVRVDLTTPSSHVAIARFDYGVTPFAGSSTAISRRPLFEWHHFANVPAPNQHGFRLTISRSGDWTAALIDDKPSHVWVKGIPCAGVGNIDQLFRKVIWVATGSGIGPCLPHLLAQQVPSRLVWSTRHPRRTYGDDLVDEILDVQPDALIWDTDSRGKPDLLLLAYQAYVDFGAEAVICISNKKTTWQIVEGLETRGIPAYGAIWDS